MKKLLILLVVLASFGKTSNACSPYSVPPLTVWDLTGDILTMDYVSNTAWGCDYNIVLEIACLDGTIISTETSACVSKPDASPMAYPSPTFTIDLTTLGLCSDETYQFRAKETPCGTTAGGSAWTGYTTFIFDPGGGPGGPMALTMDDDTITICLGETANLGCEVTNNCTPVNFTWNPGSLPGEDVTVSPGLGFTTYTVTAAESGVCGNTLFGDIVVEVLDVAIAGTATATPNPICDGESTTITLVGHNGNIQWQEGPTSSGPWTDVSGETGTTLDTGPLSTTTWFQAEVTNACGLEFAQVEVVVNPNPTALFEFEVDGVSSSTGLTGGCYLLDVDFFSGSFVGSPSNITNWDWNFGDGNFSTDENPTHNYDVAGSGPGSYTVTLTVTTDGGCVDVYTLEVIMTDSPDIDIVQNNPSCWGFSDGSFTILVSGGSGGAGTTFEIYDSTPTLINIGGSNAVNSLTSGTYTYDVDDNGCMANGTVIIDDPDSLVIDLDLNHVLCNGDNTGYVYVDTVTGWQGVYGNIAWNWSSGPPGGAGFDSDTLLVAGQYTVSITDDNGCQQEETFEITEPPLLEFSEIGYEPAYCRLYDYQVGNGQVYAAATGGTPDYTYLWELLNVLPLQTNINTTWGALNPGDYEITVTDGNGCILTQVVTVDSVNPTAILDVQSADLNGNLQGTAPVCVEFTNISEWFANPLNPIADTTFWLSLDFHDFSDWELYEDSVAFFTTYDTCYTEGGEYNACLKVKNKNGCVDSVCHLITVYTPLAITPPNVFTPDGDGINDVYTFEFLAKGVKEINVIIVNRWGVKMAEINDINVGWDGTDRSGSKCRDGTYFFVYTGEAENGDPFEGQGTIQIIGSKK